MNRHLRELAPVSDAAWEAIMEEAKGGLKATMTGRRLIDFSGPLGSEVAAVGTGRVKESARDFGEVRGRTRDARPLIELRATFELQRSELEAVDRGARDPDLMPVTEAARALAMAEDRLVFHGLEEAGVSGICEGSSHEPLTIGDDFLDYPRPVVEAVHRLAETGVAGPYAIALGPQCHAGVARTIHPGGLAVLDTLKRILDGQVLRAPAIQGAVVLSTRGGDFELVCGEDVALGYEQHDRETVTLYLEETATFRLYTPEAAVWLRYEAS